MLLIARFESLVVVMSDKESSDGSRSGERMENAGGKPERRGSDGEVGAGEQELATKMLQIQSKRYRTVHCRYCTALLYCLYLSGSTWM